MSGTATFIGFGEAGRALAPACARAFDIKTLSEATRPAMAAAYEAEGVQGFESAQEALQSSFKTFSLVTADQALAAARAFSRFLSPGSFWFDLNSVAPATKVEAARFVEEAGGRYVDVAVMAPVLPARLAVPLVVSGPDAGDAAALLELLGFSDVTVVGREVGQASTIKLIRSVMVKGMEALTAECLVAASQAGVVDRVIASLDASWQEQSWEQRADYNIGRVLAHGSRRAEEMTEAATMLEAMGVSSAMTRATAELQRKFAAPGSPAPAGLAGKLAAMGTAGSKVAV